MDGQDKSRRFKPWCHKCLVEFMCIEQQLGDKNLSKTAKENIVRKWVIYFQLLIQIVQQPYIMKKDFRRRQLIHQTKKASSKLDPCLKLHQFADFTCLRQAVSAGCQTNQQDRPKELPRRRYTKGTFHVGEKEHSHLQLKVVKSFDDSHPKWKSCFWNRLGPIFHFDSVLKWYYRTKPRYNSNSVLSLISVVNRSSVVPTRATVRSGASIGFQCTNSIGTELESIGSKPTATCLSNDNATKNIFCYERATFSVRHFFFYDIIDRWPSYSFLH